MENTPEKTVVELPKGFSDAESYANNLTEQLRMAGVVQRDFLPKQPPDFGRLEWATTFLPAEWVSGDIYDIVRIDEKHVGFYVADVVGHGVPAALLTIFLKQALVMRVTVGNRYRICRPAEVMRNLNKRLCEQKFSGSQFVTCCYCLLNVHSMELIFSRAGHPYPLLYRPGEPTRQLEARGALLGVFEDADFGQERLQLKKGDKLLLYSDGAETFIGRYDDQRGFEFNPEFAQLLEMPIFEMNGAFEKLTEGRQLRQAEVDDITTLGLEIR